MFETHRSPGVQAILKILEREAGYSLDAKDKQVFSYFHHFITSPEPRFITDLRADPKTEKWYHGLVNGVLGDVQNSLACVLYHSENLKSIETNVLSAASKVDFRSAIGESTVAGGNTRALDFEYQAFVLSYRRCLDYWTRAISSYFKNSFHSFRKADRYFSRFESSSVPGLLVPVIQEYRGHFDFVLSNGDAKSVRDRVSHYEYVPAGVFNLSRRGLVLYGGGEELLDGVQTLSEAIDQRTLALRSFLREVIAKSVDGMRADNINHSN